MFSYFVKKKISLLPSKTLRKASVLLLFQRAHLHKAASTISNNLMT